MGKQGPCCHCGVTTTPLWRNGPPEKPVLCNACGSRWRTKGSLVNYVPLHACKLNDSEGLKVSKAKNVSFKPKEKKLVKIKEADCDVEYERKVPCSDQNFLKALEVDTSNRSSSGSVISYSESCGQFGTAEASDLAGSAQSNVRDLLVPSKKRTSVARQKPSSVEKLTNDLRFILHEQQSSYGPSTEEDLIYDGPTPTGSIEIGSGSVLLRYPNPKTIEEESEASSLPRDNKSCMTYDTFSGSASFPLHSDSKGNGFLDEGMGKLKKSAASGAQESPKRDKSPSDKLHMLRDMDSSSGFTDLKDLKCNHDLGGKGVATGPNILRHSSLTSLKRPRDVQNQHVAGSMRSPKRVSNSSGSGTNLPSTVVPRAVEDLVDTDDACFSLRSFFATPDVTDHDLLLLGVNPQNPKPGGLNSSPSESGAFVADGEDSASKFSASSSSSEQPPKHR